MRDTDILDIDIPGADPAAVVAQYEPFIKKLASRYTSILDRSGAVGLEDLYQVGCIAVLEAQKRYDPAGGASFITFITLPIKSAMRRALGFNSNTGAAPVQLVYLDEPITIESDGEITRIDTIPDSSILPFDEPMIEDETRKETAVQVRAAVARLKSAKQREAIQRVYFDGMERKTAAAEMGMNHKGEISVLTKIAKPTISVITNIGTSHIGNLGSRENILKAKLEILDGMKPNGTVVINNDNDLLHKWYLENKENYNIVTYGIENESNYMAENIKFSESGSTYTLKGTDKEVVVPVGGEHFVQNSLCAIAVGKIFDTDIDAIIEGIAKFELTKKRMDTEVVDNVTIIGDYYNANYDSMKAALNYLGKVENKRKIAILGDMLELGEYSKELHENVGKEVINNNIDILITVGTEAKYIANIAKEKLANVFVCENIEEAIEKINEIKKENDVVLLKASNGMKFGEILEGMKGSK